MYQYLVTSSNLTFNVGGDEADDRHGDGEDEEGLAHHGRKDSSSDVVNVQNRILGYE